MITKFTIQQEPGFYLDRDKATMPECSGVYIVYRCDYESYNDIVNLDEVLYIGESQNIYKHFNDGQNNPTWHKHYDDLVKKAGGANHLCYGIVPMNMYQKEQREWIRDALVFYQKPILNSEDKKERYLHPEVEIIIKDFPDCWNTSHIFLPLQDKR